MEHETLTSRLAKLIQRSRKAIRLYSNASHVSHGQGSGEHGSEFAELQVCEWRRVNTELLQRLLTVANSGTHKKISQDLSELCERFYAEWRASETKLHEEQRELVAAAEHADFVRSAMLGRELVILKARMQATEAVYHELSLMLGSARIDHVPGRTESQMEFDLDEALVRSEPEDIPVPRAKIIPLRR